MRVWDGLAAYEAPFFPLSLCGVGYSPNLGARKSKFCCTSLSVSARP